MSTGFLGFIKKIGSIAVKAINISAAVSPAVAAVLATTGHADVASTLMKVENLAIGVEVTGTAIASAPLTGAQKLAVLAPSVDNLIKNSGFLSNRAIADAAKWDAAVAAFSSAIVDLSNATTPIDVPAA